MDEKKNSLRTSLAFAFSLLISCSAILPILGLQSSQNISSYGTVSYAALPRLHTDGKYIKDALGNPVFLRGVNMLSLGWMITGNENIYREDVWANIRSWGCKAVRLPIAQDFWVESEDYRLRVDRIMDLAEKYHIYVIVDRHKEFHDQPIKPFPTDVNAWIAMCVDVVKRYKERTNVLFEIYNEPHYPTTETQWIDAAQKCVNAIRAVNPDIVLLVPSLNHIKDIHWVKTTSITGGNIVYILHWYINFTPANIEPPYPVEEIKAWLTDKGWKWLIDDEVAPMLVSEAGVTNEEEGVWLKNFLSVLNEWEVGYTIWSYYPTLCPLIEEDWLTPTFAGRILIDAIKAASSPT